MHIGSNQAQEQVAAMIDVADKNQGSRRHFYINFCGRNRHRDIYLTAAIFDDRRVDLSLIRLHN